LADLAKNLAVFGTDSQLFWRYIDGPNQTEAYMTLLQFSYLLIALSHLVAVAALYAGH